MNSSHTKPSRLALVLLLGLGTVAAVQIYYQAMALQAESQQPHEQKEDAHKLLDMLVEWQAARWR